jgi:[acyl-carrier-protein] S-malonyltransferase
MNKRYAFLFSGQGAQVVGMGKDLAAKYPVAAELFQRADAVLGYPLSQLAFEGPEEELTKTVHCQPALYVHGFACLAALKAELGADLIPFAVAGLSLGEFTAHAAAGTFDFETGLKLVAQRARFMQEACDSTEGGMAAMIGGEEAAIRTLAASVDVDIANLNAPGQIVISGEKAKVTLAVAQAKDAGVRKAVPLNVAGAYHSRLMKSAADKLGAALSATEFNAPSCKVYCNVEAAPVSTPEVIRETLQKQVTGSVRWTETLEKLVDEDGIEQFIEFGPGGVLAGLLGRTRKGAAIVSISDVATLAASLEKFN